MSDKIDFKTEQIAGSKLEQLANDSANVVYEYSHDTPEGFMEPEDQATVLRDLVATFDYFCRGNRDACDEHVREQVMTANKKFRTFQRLYPMVFANITVRALDAQMTDRLDKVRKLSMLFVMERWKGDGDEEQKHARAMHTAMRISMRDTKPEDLEHAGVADVSMTPMSASEFGESTVKQG